jgi:hypothetical protein
MESFGMHQQPDKSRADTIEYIQSMLAQLRSMAQAEKFDMLAYLIEMAYLEAGEALRGELRTGSAGQKRNAAS